MQWLIDIIKEWVIAQGYLSAGFVDRGDPTAIDWTHATLTQDNVWHDLDLSAVVPAGAKAVLFTMGVNNTVVNKDAFLRRKDNINNINIAVLRTQIAGIGIYGEPVCPCNSNRLIQYRFHAGGWTDIRLSVKGWWF